MDKIVARVQKILALRDSSNPAEAELALQRAQEIMLRHNLPGKVLESEPTHCYVREVLYEGRLPREASFVFLVLREYFFVRLVLEVIPKGKRVWVLGRPENCAVAQQVYCFLCSDFKEQWAMHRARSSAQEAGRMSFYRGLVRGLLQRLRTTGALVSGDEGLDDFVRTQFDRFVIPPRIVKERSYSDEYAGFYVGHRMSFDRRRS